MDPEQTRHVTDVDDFWDDDDTTDDYTPRRAHHNTVARMGPVGAAAPRQLDTDFWDDDDTHDTNWDAAAGAPAPAHAPIRGLDDRSIGAWSPALEHRPPWYRTRAVAVIAAAAATGVTALVFALHRPTDDHNAPSPTPPTRPSATKLTPTPSTTAPPAAIAPPPAPAPPPPPPAEQTSPPAGGGGGYTQWPRSAPPQTEKPRIDVTRAPISVAPEPRTPAKTAAPGGSGGRGGWPW
ncbi:hypothetical protein [Mycobacterium sp. 29Ha]|uniref:hypothetical protein n=1 Tax=Mycobacterium sp. 29Ha TaxID=2939268 RepID=UPI0029390EFE|nr:hypothetical protein [Mycobacterium sp. 29Ha]MDV3133298.1 hypothetical protein [Mycobacterium sp. 29Ha]